MKTDHNNTLKLTQLEQAISIDFDWSGGYFYWTEVSRHQSTMIRRMKLSDFRNASGMSVNEDDGKLIETVHRRGVAMAHGLSIDWVAKNMYWTDKGDLMCCLISV